MNHANRHINMLNRCKHSAIRLMERLRLVKTIIKVQAPIFPNDAPALVYNKSRSMALQCPMDAAMEKALNGDLKAYFKAKIENGKVRLIKRIPDQDW